MHLLDVNVLIALGDSNHPHRAAALRFFEAFATVDGWATCPLTENAFIRILGGQGYLGGPGSTGEALRLLKALVAAPGHQFWPDDLSLTHSGTFPSLPVSRHLTDLYLLALAVKHGGRFATLDLEIDPSLIPGGPAALYCIPKG
ncbi:MAG: TA system VapC family ribonuclease toxin [Verrucomicrobiia bacterium]